jgi:hypothetical protein
LQKRDKFKGGLFMSNFYSDNTIVAFLDILGFKNLVYNSEHSKLIKVYQNLLLPIVQISSSLGKVKVIENGAVADTSKAVVNSIVVSDNIILWTPDASKISFDNIVSVVLILLVSSIYTGIPLRGSISMGPLSMISETNKIDNKLFWNISAVFGKSLVDAYNLEKDQQWSGCIIDKRLYNDNKDPELERFEYLKKSDKVMIYNVPFKCKGKYIEISHYAIDWPRGNEPPPTENMVRNAFSLHNKSIEDEDVKIKIENTIKFLNYSLKNSHK